MSLFGSPRRERRDDHGAAAVEFALVAMVFITLLMGMLDYGMYFNASLGARGAVREAAREAAVNNNFPAAYPAGSSYTNCLSGTATRSFKVACAARLMTAQQANVPPVDASGKQRIFIRVETGSTGWTRGATVQVCALVLVPGLTGLVPTPSGGETHTVTQLSIEVAGATGAREGQSDTIPSGVTPWSTWCPDPA